MILCAHHLQTTPTETFPSHNRKSFIWRTNNISQQKQQNILVINHREKCLKWDLMCLSISKVSKFLIWWNDQVSGELWSERERKAGIQRTWVNAETTKINLEINNCFMGLSVFPRLGCYFYYFWHFHWIFLLCG